MTKNARLLSSVVLDVALIALMFALSHAVFARCLLLVLGLHLAWGVSLRGRVPASWLPSKRASDYRATKPRRRR